MATDNRPLSPHLQVYKLPLLAILSITHRITGVGLSLGLLLLAYWVIAAATGAESFVTAQELIGSVIGRLVLFAFTLTLFYHLLNGIRHLFWDSGYNFELENAEKSGWAVVAGAGALTIITWVIGYSV